MQGEIVVDVPYSVRYVLGGMDGSILQTYRGEFKFDRFNVALLTARGSDNGVVLRYGKNIIRLSQDEDYTSTYTGIAPYYKSDEATVTLPEVVMFLPGTFDFERILSLDLSDKFEDTPTADQLRAAAEAYAVANNISVPDSSIEIDYVMDSAIESVKLCDTISVYYSKIGVTATAKCVKTEYDVLLDRYSRITLGSIRTSIADAYAAQTQDLTKRIRRIEADYTTDGAVREIAREEITNDTSIIQQAEAIIASALEEYVRTSDYDTFRSTIATQFSVLAGEVSANFTSVTTDINTLSGSTEQQFASIYSFIRLLATITDSQGHVTQEGGIVIGESSSEIKLKLENDVLYFFTGDDKLVTAANAIAYFAANQLVVNNTSIQNLTLGTQGEYLDARIVGSGDNVCVLWSGRLS